MNWKTFRQSGHTPTLFASFLYFDLSFMVWVMIGALGVFISQDFGLTAAQKGLLTAIPLLGGALARIPVGLLADRFGYKRIGLVTLAIVCVPLSGGWLWGTSYPQMLVIGLLLGVAGSSFAVALPLASRWYPSQHQGLVMGIAGAGNSGTVLAAILAPRLAQQAGWHTVFGFALAAIVVNAMVFSALAKEPPRTAPRQTLGEMMSVFRQVDCVWFCLLYAVTFGGFVGFASFLNIFLFDEFGITKIQAANFTALCVFAGSFVRPVGGFLADRFGGFRVLRALLMVAVFCLCGIGFLPSLPITITLFFVLMAALGTGNGSVFQMVPQRFSKEIGRVTGIVGAVGGLGGFLLPSLLGSVKQQTGSFGSGFWILALLVCGAFVALLQVQRGILRHRKVPSPPMIPTQILSRTPAELAPVES
jgi:NNP family nitrate/nitrite transporter-like MFS transporter